MGFVERVQRWIRGTEPTLVDYEGYAQQADSAVARAEEGLNAVVGRVGPATSMSGAGNYKIQQSYDSLLNTVQELRAALDGQARRQEELFSRLSTLPAAAEALPQTSKMQAEMLKMINDRLSMHAEQQRKVSDVVQAIGPKKGSIRRCCRASASRSRWGMRSIGSSWNRSIGFQ